MTKEQNKTKATKKKEVKAEKPKKTVSSAKGEKYIECIGRRKKSSARVRIYPSSKVKSGAYDITVNEKDFSAYFPLSRQRKMTVSPFLALDENMKVTALVKGGGIASQAEALRLGISRALVKDDEKRKEKLKAYGYLTRDPRMIETKKFGSRKARRPQQWRKR